MPDRTTHTEQDLDLPEEEQDTGAMLDSQVQKAQEQLVQLRRQQELIEKQKRELEELSRRQEELERGKGDMIEKLARSLTLLERETYEAEKRVEQLRATHQIFAEHLDVLEAINPKAWNQADLNKELSKALSDVDDARAVFAKNRSRINAAPEEVVPDEPSDSGYGGFESGGEKNFLYWLNAGFAFTLPIFILGLIAILVFIFHTPVK